MSFPSHRPRRLRRSELLRSFVRETRLSTQGLIYPLFVCPGNNVRNEVSSMPGVAQQSVDRIVEECREVEQLGIPAVILFGLPEKKDEIGSEAVSPDGVVQRAIEAIRKARLNLLVLTDVCLCEYTSHGHCGVLKGEQVQNDATVDLLAAEALSHARAGADIVAPSDMMDGRVGAIRRRLDEHGFRGRGDPFLRREILLWILRAVSRSRAIRAAIRRPAQLPDGSGQCPRGVARGCARSGRRRGHGDGEAGLPYLDVIRQVRDRFDVPVAAYNVSGEYAMVKAAARNGWIDEHAWCSKS